MSGILERNYKKVWLGALAGMSYLILEKNQSQRFIEKDNHDNNGNRQMTITYRRPFCPVATVFHTDLDNLFKDEFWDNLSSKTVKQQPGAKNKWVLTTPFGSHQITTTNNRGEILTGYYSRIFGIPVFPFSRLNALK